MNADDSRSAADVTGVFRYAQASAPMPLLWLCGHKGERAGAWMRGGLPWMCPRCNKERKS